MATEWRIDGGFKEATTCAADPIPLIETLVELGGWEVVSEGALPGSLLDSWGAGKALQGDFYLLGNPGDSTGYLRLHQVRGVEQVFCRPNPQTWDTGGIIDLNVRVLDFQEKYQGLIQRGWTSTADPVRWAFGPGEVEEWIGIGPSGLALAIIERVHPPLEGWDTLKKFSRVFNSSQIVADMPRALDFYEQGLGFQKILHQSVPLSEKPGPNVLGIPHNLVPDVAVEIAILQAAGQMDGSVELVAFHGLEGRDFSDRSQPWNLGISSLRFEVDGLEAFCAHLTNLGQPVSSPVRVLLEPYGLVKLVSSNAPDGALLEFFELTDD